MLPVCRPGTNSRMAPTASLSRPFRSRQRLRRQGSVSLPWRSSRGDPVDRGSFFCNGLALRGALLKELAARGPAGVADAHRGAPAIAADGVALALVAFRGTTTEPRKRSNDSLLRPSGATFATPQFPRATRRCVQARLSKYHPGEDRAAWSILTRPPRCAPTRSLRRARAGGEGRPRPPTPSPTHRFHWSRFQRRREPSCSVRSARGLPRGVVAERPLVQR
jgi:hypothetical protein